MRKSIVLFVFPIAVLYASSPFAQSIPAPAATTYPPDEALYEIYHPLAHGQ